MQSHIPEKRLAEFVVSAAQTVTGAARATVVNGDSHPTIFDCAASVSGPPTA